MLLPPASLMLLFVAGLVLMRWRRRAGKAACLGAVALLYFLSTGVGSWLLVHPLEQLEPVLASPASPAGAGAQAVVVLSAGRIKRNPEYGGRPMPDFICLERMAYAALVVRARALPLLVSGGFWAEQDEESLAAGMQRVFDDVFQLPVRWVEARSRNTSENARFSAALLKQSGIKQVILITDAMHMRRARLSFERAGIAVVPGPTFYNESGPFNPLRLTPSAENLRRSHYAIYEWLGLAWYALAGR
ncbi:MAG: YdcF family protein [Massilia sp.]|nr:YdcF family protein [Massilia sp.]